MHYLNLTKSLVKTIKNLLENRFVYLDSLLNVLIRFSCEPCLGNGMYLVVLI